MIALADDRWRRRAQRARALADQHASSAEPLRFYAALAELQEQLLQRYRRTVIVEAAAFADRRDPAAAVHVLSEAPGGITRRAPPALRHALSPLDGSTAAIWRERIVTCWRTGARDAAGAEPADLFAIESLLQPFAEHAAAAIDPPQDDSSACPRCGGAAVVAALREQAHGARRWLVCGFCLHEWPAPRLVCTVCGESRVEALPVFRADLFHAIRLDACQSCRTVVKTIDLTRAGDAVPIVDDLASLPLDLWAAGEGYRRRPNLLRLDASIHD